MCLPWKGSSGLGNSVSLRNGVLCALAWGCVVRPPKNHNPVAKRVTQTSKNKAAVAAATPSGEGDAESIGLAGAGGGVAQNTEPISEVSCTPRLSPAQVHVVRTSDV